MAAAFLNHLFSNRTQLFIDKLPNTNLSINEHNLPGLSLGESLFHTPAVNIPMGGDKIEFEALEATFIVDEQLSNWIDVFNWMRAIGAPAGTDEFSYDRTFVDAKIIGYNSHQNPILTMNFHDCVPMNLSTITVTEEEEISTNKIATLSMKFMDFTIDVNDNL